MEQRTTEPSVSDSIDEFFEPVLGDGMDEVFEDDAPVARSKSRIAELRRRAEEKLEERRMQAELDYLDLDWDD